VEVPSAFALPMFVPEPWSANLRIRPQYVYALSDHNGTQQQQQQQQHHAP
jgi:hypothetical protein